MYKHNPDFNFEKTNGNSWFGLEIGTLCLTSAIRLLLVSTRFGLGTRLGAAVVVVVVDVVEEVETVLVEEG